MIANSPQRGRTARNFSLLILSELAGQSVAFLLSAYLARVLGHDGFGVWTFAMSVIVYLTIVVDAGTENWGMREVSAFPARLRTSVAGVVGLRLLLASALAAALSVLAFVGMSTPDRRWIVAFGTLSLLAFALNPAWALRSIEIAAPVAVANLFQRLIMLGLALALVHSPDDVRYVTLWQGVADLAAAALCFAALSQHGLPPLTAFRLTRMWRVLRQAWPMGIARAVRGAMFTANVVVLAYTWPDTVVGEFGAAQRIALILLLVSSIFGFAVFPAISRACAMGGVGEQVVMAASFRLLVALLAPVSAGVAMLAQPILALVFGPPYAAAAVPLQILTATVFVIGMSDNMRRVLQARQQQVLDLRLVSVAVLVSLPLIGLVVPLAGMVGAAAMALVGELILLVLVGWGVHRTGPAAAFAAALARPAGAAALMAAGVYPLRHLSLALTVPIGAFIYIAVLLLWRERIVADLHLLEAARPAQDQANGH